MDKELKLIKEDLEWIKECCFTSKSLQETFYNKICNSIESINELIEREQAKPQPPTEQLKQADVISCATCEYQFISSGGNPCATCGKYMNHKFKSGIAL